MQRPILAKQRPQESFSKETYVTTLCDNVVTKGGEMTQIGVRALKAQLSEHLRRAHAGERYVVTDRGAAIATIGPATAPKLGLSPRIPSRGILASAMIIEDRR